MKATANMQEPYVYGSLGGGDVILVPGRAAAIPAPITALDPNSQLRRDYELAAQINTEAGWDAFLKTYATGFYADLARAARGKLGAPAMSATADSRNLSAGDAHSAAATGAGPGFDKFIGRSFRLSFAFVQDEVSPQPGIKRGNRELVVYVKSAGEIATRLTTLYADSSKNISRFAFGALGDVNRGTQVSFADRQLWPILAISNFRLKASISVDGNTCRGKVEFELDPGNDHFELRRIGNGEAMNVRALTAERLTCWVSDGDSVGQPPATAAKPRP
jgi:hypothetical protein